MAAGYWEFSGKGLVGGGRGNCGCEMDGRVVPERRTCW